MNEFNKILEIANDKTVKLSHEFKGLLGTELQLGMSNFVCKNGALSDGFEKLLPSQRYYQSIKEMWTYGSSIRETEAVAVKAQADLQWSSLLDKLFGWVPIFSLYIRSKKMLATQRLTNLLVMIEDQARILNAFNEVRVQLQDQVRAKYGSIEEAEPDNWEAVLKYRIARKKLGNHEMLNSVPGTPEDKALAGLSLGTPETALWLAIDKEQEINDQFNGDVVQYLAAKGYVNILDNTDNKVIAFKKKD